MAMTVELKFDINEKVFVREEDALYEGEIESAEVMIDNDGTKTDYTVYVHDWGQLVGYEEDELLTRVEGLQEMRKELKKRLLSVDKQLEGLFDWEDNHE